MSAEHSFTAVMEPSIVFKHTVEPKLPQFLSTAKAARMLGLSTTLVQTLVDQGELKGWKTRGGHRRISLESIQDYQSTSRSSMGVSIKSAVKPRVIVVVESAQLMDQLMTANAHWTLPVDVTFFDSVTEALLSCPANVRTCWWWKCPCHAANKKRLCKRSRISTTEAVRHCPWC